MWLDYCLLLLFSIAINVKAEESQTLSNGFGDDIDWVHWDQAVSTAMDLEKPIFLLIHKTWCGACKQLKQSFKTSSKRKELVEMSKKFVMVNTEDDDEPEDDLYAPDGRYIPRLFLLDNNGQPLDVTNARNYAKNAHYFPQVIDVLWAMKEALRLFAIQKRKLAEAAEKEEKESSTTPEPTTAEPVEEKKEEEEKSKEEEKVTTEEEGKKETPPKKTKTEKQPTEKKKDGSKTAKKSDEKEKAKTERTKNAEKTEKENKSEDKAKSKKKKAASKEEEKEEAPSGGCPHAAAAKEKAAKKEAEKKSKADAKSGEETKKSSGKAKSKESKKSEKQAKKTEL